jgi:hypothetical protein
MRILESRSGTHVHALPAVIAVAGDAGPDC